MINLMSQEDTRELRAARDNTLLSRYNTALFTAIGIIIASVVFGYVALNLQESNFRNIVEAQAPEKARYKDDLAAAKAYSDDLKTAKTILTNEVMFSDVLVQIAKVLPDDATLSTLTITSETITEPLELTITTNSYDEAVRAKDRVQQSEYFKGAKLLTVARTGESNEFTAVIVTSINSEAFIKLKEER